MEMTIKTSQIAENIKAIRTKFNLTQIEMAEVLGYSERQVRRLETDGTYNLEVINLIAKTFNVSVKDILFENGMF
jgi:transcriptional regulator with XRE-family HTH domain